MEVDKQKLKDEVDELLTELEFIEKQCNHNNSDLIKEIKATIISKMRMLGDIIQY
jgi:hypothetical protein